MGSTTIHAFPELRALAEEEARAFAAAWERACDADWLAWERLDQMTRERRITAHLTLLCDLSRPASRDAVARLVANRVKLACGTTAPAFRIRDAESPMRWVLVGAWDEREFTYERPRDYIPPRENGSWLLVPSLVGITDSAEALVIVVRHLWPEEAPRG